MAVLEDLQKPLQSYLKEKGKHDVEFVSSSKTNCMRLLHDRTPLAVIHWGHQKGDEIIKRIVGLNRRPRKIVWVIDTREDSIDSDGNRCSNADLLERNHMKLYPFYTLDRVVGIDVAPQRGEQLTLVAFYKRCDEDLKANRGSQSRDNSKSGPKAESKVPSQQVPSGPNHKRKAPDQKVQNPIPNKTVPSQQGPRAERRDRAQKGSSKGSRDTGGPIGAKRPHRDRSPQLGRRGPSRPSYQRARGPSGPQNPWANSNSFDSPMLAPNQDASGVMSQLTNVIGQQLLLAQMNSALLLTSSSNTVDDMGLDRGAGFDHGGQDWMPRGSDDFSPPPPSWKPREDYRSATGGDVASENFRSTAREDFARVNKRRAVRGDNDHEDFRGSSRDDVYEGNYGSAARQELTSNDFWNTPLEDLTRNKFKSSSPIRSPSTSREAVASMSNSRGEFQEDYYSSPREELSRSNFFRSADQEEFQGTSPTWGHGTVRGTSRHNENHSPSNFRRTTQNDIVRSKFGSAAQDDVSENLRSTARESSTRKYTRWDPQEKLKEVRTAPKEDLGMASLHDLTRRYSRSPTREDSRSAVRRDFPYDHLRSTMNKIPITQENDYKKAARANSTHTDVRRTPWEEAASASRGDFPHQDSRSGDYDYKRAVHADSALTQSGRAPWEEARSASGKDFSHENYGSAMLRDFPSGTLRSTTREDLYDDSWKTARKDSPHTDVRYAPWESARSASREDVYREDSRRAVQGDFNGAARGNSMNTTRQDSFSIEPMDILPENLSRHEFFGSRRSAGRSQARYSFDSTNRNSVGDENFSFSSGNTGYHRRNIDSRDIHSANSGRFGLDQGWGGDITRRNF